MARLTDETKEVALNILNELIVIEYKINKKTKKHISHKYNIPYLYVSDYILKNNINQYEESEREELLLFFDKITLKEIETENIYLLSAFRNRVLEILEFGEDDNFMSLGEKTIKEYLERNKIYFKQEYSFKDVPHIKNLRFDFYLPTLDTCIEFDGIQHYKAIDFFGGKKELDELKKRDELKNIYCLENNIKLIRICYKDIKKIEKILNIELREQDGI